MPSPLQRSHYDVALYSFAVRNVANYSPPVLPREEGMPDEWKTLLRLTGAVTRQGPNADVTAIDDFVAAEAARRHTATKGSPVEGRDPAAILAALAPRVGPERLLDLQLRCGPYGDAFAQSASDGQGTEGARSGGLTLAAHEAAPHGIDLGPLQPRLPDALRTPSGKVELAPGPLVADVPRLLAELDEPCDDEALVLIGRRDLRSNNSWMHNLPLLVRGKPRCTVWVHPDDAARLGLKDGEPARISSRAGEIEVPVEVTDDVIPGVVSMPHGWGHDAPGAALRVAAEHAGVNSNLLADEELVDPISGTAVLNGIPVELAPLAQPAASSSSRLPNGSVA